MPIDKLFYIVQKSVLDSHLLAGDGKNKGNSPS